MTKLWASAPKAIMWRFQRERSSWGEAGFGVFTAAVQLLVGGGGVGDLEEVFGAVEAGLGVALSVVAFAGGGGDADGFSVFVGTAGAGDGDQVVPAVGVGAGAALQLADGQRQEGSRAGVEEDAFVGAAFLRPQFVAAAPVVEGAQVAGFGSLVLPRKAPS